MSDPLFTSAEMAALDRFAVPPFSAGFADRLVAASADRAAPEVLPTPWQRRGGRIPWRRRASIVSGGLALGLLSAGAAATGYLGEPARQAVREAPVIGPIIARVAPAPKPIAPKPKRVAAKPTPTPATMETPAPRNSEIIVQRIVKKIEERVRQRRETGRPPPGTRRAEIVRELRQLPPEERIEVVQRLREIRRERIAERWRQRQEMRTQRWGGQPASDESDTSPDQAAPPTDPAK